jgi:hypothetical protein
MLEFPKRNLTLDLFQNIAVLYMKAYITNTMNKRSRQLCPKERRIHRLRDSPGNRLLNVAWEFCG